MVAAALPPDTPPIAAAVLGAIPADLVKLGGHGPERLFIGEPMEDAKKLYVEASPLARIHEHSVPMFLYHGTWDWLIRSKERRVGKEGGSTCRSQVSQDN